MKYIYTVFMLALALLQAHQASAQAVTGAGSSAAAPIYRSWAKAYARATGSRVDYDPVGSSAGMKKIQ
ncbi:MAG: substrate-binding domain-containing protein, partial [Acidovorax sp.]|nr:substrate-binding domain-containing protein [Acidovorax sp.]